MLYDQSIQNLHCVHELVVCLDFLVDLQKLVFGGPVLRHCN